MKKIDLVGTLYKAYGPSVQVCVPFGKASLTKSVDEMEFTVRATNCLKRAGLFTVGDIVELITNEIKTKLLVYGFEQLNPTEQLAFLKDVIVRNQKE